MGIIMILMLLFLVCFFGVLILQVAQVWISKKETDAIILEFFELRSGRYGSITYRYRFEYYVNGKKYTKVSYWGSNKKINIGEKVKVKYPENKPEDAYLSEMEMQIVTTSLGMIIGCLLLILYCVIAIN